MKTTRPINRINRHPRKVLVTAMAFAFVQGCGSGGGAGGESIAAPVQPAALTQLQQNSADLVTLENSGLTERFPESVLSLRVSIPSRIERAGVDAYVDMTIAGDDYVMTGGENDFRSSIVLERDREYPLFVAVRRQSDDLLLASTRQTINTSASEVSLAIPSQEFDTDMDFDSDGFSNIAEIERGSDPVGVSEDFDRDGIANDSDSDDDNDGVADSLDAFPLNAGETLDSDRDGIGDNEDRDDDNDSILDVDDKFPLNPEESLDIDLDGIGNNEDTDDDGDGVIDLEDPQPSNPDINGNEDTDGDGYRDRDDAFPFDPDEHNDVDGDGIGDFADLDDDGNGVPDNQDNAIVPIPYTDNPPRIDGAYAADEWNDAVSADSKGNYLWIDHLMIDNNNEFINEGYDVRHRWRAMHNGDFIYLLVMVYNEPFFERHDDSADIWHDDGIEIFFDIGNEKSSTYDSNDYQVLLRYNYTNPESVVQGFNSASGLWVSYCSNLGLETPQTEITYYEAKISLSSIGLSPNQPFSMDVQINDDNDGENRDSKWGWHATAGQDETWNNPSQLGAAILQPSF